MRSCWDLPELGRTLAVAPWPWQGRDGPEGEGGGGGSTRLPEHVREAFGGEDGAVPRGCGAPGVLCSSVHGLVC